MVQLNFLIIPLAALLRSIFGWIENSLEDGEIELFEWQQLGATIFRLSLPIVGLIYALDVDPTTASGIVVFIDWIILKFYNALKN